MPAHTRGREGGDVCAIFVHAGAGFHSYANEKTHLAACQEYVFFAISPSRRELTVKVLAG